MKRAGRARSSGTFVEIAVRAPDETILRRAIAVGFIAIAEVHGRMNRHDPLSEVSRLNREAARRGVAVHRSTLAVLRAAEEFAEESGGAFDITVGAKGNWRDVLIDQHGRVYFRRPANDRSRRDREGIRGGPGGGSAAKSRRGFWNRKRGRRPANFR